MQIGDVAKRTSLTADAIRFYEKRKLLPQAVRSAGRFRLYGEGTIERLHFIQQGRVTLCVSMHLGARESRSCWPADSAEATQANSKPESRNAF
jgi:MerR family regulatory protein